MKRILAGLAFVLALTLGADAFAQQTPSATPAQTTTQTTSHPPATALEPPPAPPSPAPHGRWVYTAQYGWLWVPDGATSVSVDDVPYVYLYTPAYGWTWYVSPWGWGPYFVGDWVARPWHPYVWHGWVAAPHVVVRLGPGRWHHRW
jgi:hypothetical protein